MVSEFQIFDWLIWEMPNGCYRSNRTCFVFKCIKPLTDYFWERNVSTSLQCGWYAEVKGNRLFFVFVCVNVYECCCYGEISITNGFWMFKSPINAWPECCIPSFIKLETQTSRWKLVNHYLCCWIWECYLSQVLVFFKFSKSLDCYIEDQFSHINRLQYHFIYSFFSMKTLRKTVLNVLFL